MAYPNPLPIKCSACGGLYQLSTDPNAYYCTLESPECYTAAGIDPNDPMPPSQPLPPPTTLKVDEQNND